MKLEMTERLIAIFRDGVDGKRIGEALDLVTNEIASSLELNDVRRRLYARRSRTSPAS